MSNLDKLARSSVAVAAALLLLFGFSQLTERMSASGLRNMLLWLAIAVLSHLLVKYISTFKDK